MYPYLFATDSSELLLHTQRPDQYRNNAITDESIELFVFDRRASNGDGDFPGGKVALSLGGTGKKRDGIVDRCQTNWGLGNSKVEEKNAESIVVDCNSKGKKSVPYVIGRARIRSAAKDMRQQEKANKAIFPPTLPT